MLGREATHPMTGWRTLVLVLALYYVALLVYWACVRG